MQKISSHRPRPVPMTEAGPGFRACEEIEMPAASTVVRPSRRPPCGLLRACECFGIIHGFCGMGGVGHKLCRGSSGGTG